MKHSVAVKFIAILLCAASVVSIAACGFGILFMENWNLYNTPLETIKADQSESTALNIALYYAQVQATQSLSNCPQEIVDDVLITHNHYVDNFNRSDYAVEIYDDGELVYEFNNREDFQNAYSFEYNLIPQYPIVTHQSTQREHNEYSISNSAVDMIIEETTCPTQPLESAAGLPPTTAPIPVDVIPSEASLDPAAAEFAASRDMAMKKVVGQEVIFSRDHSEVYRGEDGSHYWVTYTLDYYAGPEYLVKIFLSENAVLGTEYALMSVLYPYRDYFIPVLLASLLVFAATLVYLFTAAGHAKDGTIVPAGLNRLPLDAYAIGVISGVVLLSILRVELLDNFGSGYYSIWDNIPLCMLVLGAGIFGIALLVIGFLYAWAAQAKCKGGYWWRHSICGWCLLQVFVFLRWVRRGLRYFYRGCRAVVRLLPIIWQWLAAAVLMVAFPMIFLLFAATAWHDFWTFLWGFLFVGCLAADVAIVCYGAWCFGLLLKGVKIMGKGDLNHQIDTKYLLGCFKDFAEQLNSLAGAAQVAAERQMKSERMKTELITNVSHDIKTPLTSIINYVDLMKKPHSEEDHEAYLDVLDRQSQRLKKLIDDLMDMSKASSGNMSVEMGQVDAVEAVNQALGEFADKLEKANLTPVFRHPDSAVLMQADGRLIWRILSNVLSNAVKYALPDTRLYVDLMTLQGNAVLAIKNISREQLNVNAEELMERFVRGDASRNTEGSGLGLNIARSLVELQGGQMHLTVDGDLFKVTLIFPLI